MQNVDYTIKHVEVPLQHIDFLRALPPGFKDYEVHIQRNYVICHGTTITFGVFGQENEIHQILCACPWITTLRGKVLCYVDKTLTYTQETALRHIHFLYDDGHVPLFVSKHALYLKTLSCSCVEPFLHFPALRELHVAKDFNLDTITVTPKLLRTVTVNGKPVAPVLIDQRTKDEHRIELHYIVQGNAQKRVAAVALGCALKRRGVARDMYMYIMSWVRELDPWEAVEKSDSKKRRHNVK